MTLKLKSFLVLCFSLALVLKASHAMGVVLEAQDEVEEAKKRLQDQIDLIELISVDVERPHLSRLYFLRIASQTVFTSIEDNGLGHKNTFQEFQKLIIAYRFSEAFFEQLKTERMADHIERLKAISLEIEKVYGFDDTPYTQITLSVFTQMDKLVNQLNELPISSDLKIKLAETKPAIGRALAVAKAKRGDRRTVYPVTLPAINAIKALYPDFNKMAASDVAFEISLEIQGLNEFYIEFAEFDAEEKHSIEKID